MPVPAPAPAPADPVRAALDEALLATGRPPPAQAPCRAPKSAATTAVADGAGTALPTPGAPVDPVRLALDTALASAGLRRLDERPLQPVRVLPPPLGPVLRPGERKWSFFGLFGGAPPRLTEGIAALSRTLSRSLSDLREVLQGSPTVEFLQRRLSSARGIGGGQRRVERSSERGASASGPTTPRSSRAPSALDTAPSRSPSALQCVVGSLGSSGVAPEGRRSRVSACLAEASGASSSSAASSGRGTRTSLALALSRSAASSSTCSLVRVGDGTGGAAAGGMAGGAACGAWRLPDDAEASAAEPARTERLLSTALACRRAPLSDAFEQRQAVLLFRVHGGRRVGVALRLLILIAMMTLGVLSGVPTGARAASPASAAPLAQAVAVLALQLAMAMVFLMHTPDASRTASLCAGGQLLLEALATGAIATAALVGGAGAGAGAGEGVVDVGGERARAWQDAALVLSLMAVSVPVLLVVAWCVVGPLLLLVRTSASGAGGASEEEGADAW